MAEFCCIVFSYNRAMQLDLTLRSLVERLVNPDITYVVIYQCTLAHEASYNILTAEWKARGVTFKRCDDRTRRFAEIYTYLFHSGNLYRYVRKAPLRKRLDNFKELVEQSIQESGATFTFFSTDDQYVFKPTYIPTAALQRIQTDPENVSFRMGMSEYLTEKRRLPEKMKINKIHYEENGQTGDLLEWDARDPEATKLWEYSFNVDFQVFDSAALIRFLSPILYHIPTTLEWAGLRVARKSGRFRNMLGTSEKTVIGMQLNLAQTMVQNEASDFSLDMLNDLYKQGYRLTVREEQLKNLEWLFMPKELFFYRAENSIKLFEFQELINSASGMDSLL